ncbi:type 4a pilus biogenesis protein PilO [Curtobacterium sp. MCPF17_031]|uniref:type 4a pilus biogenesis protein PilO n=1 Tax=Curtobacterium sp. MCPF17_031 TaxID=2175653 RepID=UPI000DAA9C70|nr:type 4a pilus biogenesis protein PilO [Curtobacterium sp. MCPF17_031]PZE37664.1 hypothetical protein DEJ31_05855 [Curtobacterium sp. MCPF17_031]
MSRNRLNLVAAFVAMVLVVAGGFFLAVQPQLTQANAAHEQRSTVEENNAASRQELDRLRKQAEKLPDMQARLAQLSSSVPDSADVSGFIDELDRVAQEAGVNIASYTTSDAVPYAPPAAADASVSAAGSAPGDASTASPESTPAASAPAEPAAPSAVTNPLITSRNFSVIPVTVAVTGTLDQALKFVSALQAGERLFLITAVSSAQQSGDDGAASATSTWTFGGSVYVLDRSADASAAVSADAAK